jgi:hypothetical protein
VQVIEFNEFGSPSQLHLAERPLPHADANTAVVRIEAASVNPSDVKNVAVACRRRPFPASRDATIRASWSMVQKGGSIKRCGARAAMSASPETARMRSTSRSLSLAWFASLKCSRTNKPRAWGSPLLRHGAPSTTQGCRKGRRLLCSEPTVASAVEPSRSREHA